MKLTNNQIYNYAIELQRNFQDETQKFPIKIGFYLQKNKAILLELAQDIEKIRTEIVQSYGELNTDSDSYIIPPEKVSDASKELKDLFSLEQEIQIYKINIDSLPEDLILTAGQMESIMFMIE